MVFLPANCDAASAVLPAISWKRPFASGRTSTGCTTPFAVMEAASSAKLLLVHLRARLEGIAIDLVERNLARSAPLGSVGSGSGRREPAEAMSPALCPGRGVLGPWQRCSSF
jgi:hypothetical protein